MLLSSMFIYIQENTGHPHWFHGSCLTCVHASLHVCLHAFTCYAWGLNSGPDASISLKLNYNLSLQFLIFFFFLLQSKWGKARQQGWCYETPRRVISLSGCKYLKEVILLCFSWRQGSYPSDGWLNTLRGNKHVLKLSGALYLSFLVYFRDLATFLCKFIAKHIWIISSCILFLVKFVYLVVSRREPKNYCSVDIGASRH